MNDRTYQLVGLGGFVVSGLVFLASGIQTTDALTVAAALTWLFGCVAWGVPVWRTDRPKKSTPHSQKEK